MNIKKSAVIAFAIVVAASVASAAEVIWPTNSASDLSIFVTVRRFQIYADHCSAEIPQLRPQFQSRMEHLSSHIQGISKSLLASDQFRGLKDKPVPAEIVFGLKDALDDAEHNFQRQDAVSLCPKTLQNLAEVDDESLKSNLSDTLTAVQNMIRNLEKK